MKELKDTAEMMVSSDYKERFKAEYQQVRIRTEKLQEVLYRLDSGVLDFKLSCPRFILDEQLDVMYRYLSILEARAQIEGIDI